MEEESPNRTIGDLLRENRTPGRDRPAPPSTRSSRGSRVTVACQTDFDLVIACPAIEHGATLVTNDAASKVGAIEDRRRQHGARTSKRCRSFNRVRAPCPPMETSSARA